MHKPTPADEAAVTPADERPVKPVIETPQDGKPFPTPGKVTQGTQQPPAQTARRRRYPEPTD